MASPITMIMQIRKATFDDFDELKKVKKEFYLWECESDNMLDPTYAKKGLGIRLSSQLRNDRFAYFLAMEDGKIIGYAGVEIQKEPAFVRAAFRGHLFNLYVREGYRARGIGNGLLSKSMAWLKEHDIDHVVLLVYNHNKKAHKLYKKAGFTDNMTEMIFQY